MHATKGLYPSKTADVVSLGIHVDVNGVDVSVIARESTGFRLKSQFFINLDTVDDKVGYFPTRLHYIIKSTNPEIIGYEGIFSSADTALLISKVSSIASMCLVCTQMLKRDDALEICGLPPAMTETQLTHLASKMFGVQFQPETIAPGNAVFVGLASLLKLRDPDFHLNVAKITYNRAVAKNVWTRRVFELLKPQK